MDPLTHLQAVLGQAGLLRMNQRRFGLSGCTRPILSLEDACDWAQLTDRAGQLSAEQAPRLLGTSLPQLHERLITL